MKVQKSITVHYAVFFLILPGILMTELLDNNFFSQSQEILAAAGGQRANHFKFKSRKVGEKMITVVSLKLDPERGRRSILVPDGEGLLHPASFAHLRHPHRFIPPFEDVDQLPLNKSINWGDLVASHKKLTSVEELEAIEEKTNKVLEEIETSLTHIEESLKEEQEKEMKVKNKEKKQNNNKNKDNSKRRKRKEKKEKKQKIKEQRKENKSERKVNKDGRTKKPQNKSREKMVGDDACQYKMLRKCAKKLGLLPRKSVQVFSDFQKCSHRKRFLECVEKRRERSSCKARTVARGNLSALRTWIKKSFWTANSCLLNEALKGR